MTKAQHVIHAIVFALAAAAPVLLVTLTSSPWAHAAWAATLAAGLKWLITWSQTPNVTLPPGGAA